ncbi:hypothetical protein MMC26_001855 [Xylographa opegraphella]|nr:hypothetical protein [Xylographa opegraphella]
MPKASFFSLPSEVRLEVYKLLLAGHATNSLSLRTESPEAYIANKETNRRRTSYRIMTGRFRACSIETTYCLISNPGLHVSILGVNKRIHSEASYVLYSSNIFDFNIDVESVIPFLCDLTQPARLAIKRINIVQRALPHIEEFDRAEWRNVCQFISSNMRLEQLGLGIIGRIPAMRWEAEDLYEKSAFHNIIEFEGMEWVKQIASIKGLRNLDIRAHLEHCPPPQSNAMAFFMNFSASIEKGFAEYLEELMVIGIS